MDVLTVDIGGTFIKYAVMSDDLKISSRGKIPTPQDTRADLIDALKRQTFTTYLADNEVIHFNFLKAARLKLKNIFRTCTPLKELSIMRGFV